MLRNAVFAALALGLFAGPAAAVNVKALRSTYGPYGGVRPGSSFLPGDVVFLAFDIDDLKMDDNSGLVRYAVRLQVLDAAGKEVFKRETQHQRYLALGKAQVAERAQVIAGTDQDPGKYSVKLTILDANTKEKVTKEVNYAFELLKPDFGIIHASSPSVTFTTSDIPTYCVLVGMVRDAKGLPSCEVKLRIVDEKGKATLAKPSLISVPKDLPEEIDVKKEKMIPLPFPIHLNRAGRFTIEIEATDLLGKKTAKVSFPLLVLETSSVGG